MGIYSSMNEQGGVIDQQALVESYIFDEISHLDQEKIQEFLKSPECKAMEEAGVIGRRTIVRLNKTDDLSRRVKIAAFQIAKEKDDPMWNALVKVRIKEREYINKLVQKYGNTARRSAISGQREFLKATPTAFTRPLTAKRIAEDRE